MQNQSAYLLKAFEFEIRDVPMPECGPDDIIIEIKHVGVCGSDVGFFEDPTYGGFVKEPPLPFILGHECAGIVCRTGKDVKHLKEGDRVAVEPGIPCGKCDYCLEGRYNLCDNMIFMASPPFQTAALSRYISYPAFMAFKLPDSVSTLEGAMFEPFAVGMHAAKRSGISLGKTAVVLGSGCIGLMTLLACRALGASAVIIADLYDNRLAKAKELGASAVINSARQNLMEEVFRLTGGKGADFVFETAGSKVTAAMTPDLVKKGGKIVLVGNVHEDVPINQLQLNNNEVDVLSVFRYHGIYPLVLDAVASGKVDVSGVVSHTFKFGEVQKAFECALHEKQTAVKVAIEF
ncbi:NAD(P)-dependent alcohol dehydrogenase [Diplocloster modestus]|uniref:NAD(P)-dependent alcohol dehydrogenase n=1 Tax=Diplocloster modestus TaxID=2850322 RepID=A0ABS6K6K0_9FIRM|nr:NAD(P)-dependent alcohol dehydrogenase [Diplocloster modestus]MBU9726147.1 NAD(P)-dependent alcohol dehydrogenase [Diplocloster modestus]